MRPIPGFILCALATASPALAAPEPPALSLGGYSRVRVMSQLNYDLDATTPTDSWLFFSDIRSYLNLEAKLDRARLFSSVDLAGSDWDEGAVLGYDNPTRQRPLQLQARQLFLEYDFDALGLRATIGRMPARLGNGIVSAINRDGLRLAKSLPDLGPFQKANLTAVAVRGAKGNTLWASQSPIPPGATSDPGNSNTRVSNDPNGWAHELNTYVLAYNAAFPGPDDRFQAFVAQQQDTTQNGVYPQKRFLDLNWAGTRGPFELGGEAIHLSGQGPTAAGSRPTLGSYALFLKGAYRLDGLELGVWAGRGGGDNTPADGINGNFQSLFIDESAFVANDLFGDDLHGFDGTDASIGRGAGLANVTFVQPRLSYRFTPDLSASLFYTKHLATVPQAAGSGVLGTRPATGAGPAWNIGDEADLRLSYRWGATTFYGVVSTFVPGDVYPEPGFASAAHRLELGTELRF